MKKHKKQPSAAKCLKHNLHVHVDKKAFDSAKAIAARDGVTMGTVVTMGLVEYARKTKG